MGKKNNMQIVIKNPYIFAEWLIRQPIIRKFVSDKSAISMMYNFRFHKRMKWDNPTTFNEKLLWLTVYDRKNCYISMVDKYEAKRWMSEKLIEGGGTTQSA